MRRAEGGKPGTSSDVFGKHARARSSHGCPRAGIWGTAGAPGTHAEKWHRSLSRILRTRDARIQSEKPHHLHEPMVKRPPRSACKHRRQRWPLQKPNKSKFNNNRKNCPTKPRVCYKNKFKGKHRITWLGH